MKFKKMLLIFIMISTFIFSGCATVQYSRTISETGVIVDAVSVTLKQQDIINAGFDFEDVKQDIVNKMKIYMYAIINTFETRDDNLTQIEKINVRQNMTSEVFSKDNKIVAFFKFNNYTTFKYFYGLHLIEDTEDNNNYVEGFLYDKNISTGKTIFSGEDARFIENDFLNYFNGKFTLEDVSYEYMFGTFDSKTHSDADKQFSEDGINYHVWIVNTSNTNREIQTYYLKLNVVNWYILALIITAAFIGGAYLFVLFKKLSKSKKTSIE